MKRIEPFIARFLKYGTLISTYGLIGTVLLQIFARFLLDQAPSWTEEASRLCFIYAISFAAGLALKNRYYVHLELVYNKLSRGGQRFLDTAIPILTFILFAIMAVFSIPFVRQGFAETSPSMRMNMGVAFFSMFIMAAGLCFYFVIDIKKALKNSRS